MLVRVETRDVKAINGMTKTLITRHIPVCPTCKGDLIPIPLYPDEVGALETEGWICENCDGRRLVSP